MSTDISVHGLRCEYHVNPLGIDVSQPRLSWQLSAGRRGVVQSAYQIWVTDESSELWDTGKVLSDRSILCTTNSTGVCCEQPRCQ